MTSDASSGQQRTLVGITFKICSVAVFVAMSSLIKAAGELPAGQIVFFRSFFAIFPIVAFLAFKGQLATAFTTKRPFNHVARGVVGVGAAMHVEMQAIPVSIQTSNRDA